MGTYRVILNGQDTGEFVVASSMEDAYADVAASMPLKYSDDVQLPEFESPFARPGFPIGHNTMHESAESIQEQALDNSSHAKLS